MRIFLFLLFLCYFSVRGEVSTKCPTSKLHHLYLFSDILVVSYVLSCAEPAACDRNGANSAGAVAARRQNGVGELRGRDGDFLYFTSTVFHPM
jgi:hypothetical protein